MTRNGFCRWKRIISSFFVSSTVINCGRLTNGFFSSSQNEISFVDRLGLVSMVLCNMAEGDNMRQVGLASGGFSVSKNRLWWHFIREQSAFHYSNTLFLLHCRRLSRHLYWISHILFSLSISWYYSNSDGPIRRKKNVHGKCHDSIQEKKWMNHKT